MDALYAEKRGQELTDKILFGAANEADLQQFRKLAERHGVRA